ncbi:hypothetical protein [Lysinibacillus sphaericus]|uniref:Uncharacterized protein n=1 Tax=Lysinibacillus sphaericus OT4b.31 TaxID=1285586 RepID=R7ZCR7_LYSSH|nr:hypothetical protein [Lysinibacillus sphaericus]EON71893.1 hypothetical protein H131_13153 [Lysinibacillus sphaericus OT4b.31]
MKQIKWDFNKFEKCHCESKKYYYEYHKCDCKHDKHDCECKHDKKHHKDEKHKEHHCKGCVCNLLKCFEPGTLVDIFLSNGGRFTGVYFTSLDPRNCCAYFLEIGDDDATPVIIDCQKIDAIIKRNSAA